MNCATYFYNCIQFPLEISLLIYTYIFWKKLKRFQFVARFSFSSLVYRNQNRKRLNRFRDRWGWEITSFIFFTFPDVPRLLSPCMVAPSRAIILPIYIYLFTGTVYSRVRFHPAFDLFYPAGWIKHGFLCFIHVYPDEIGYNRMKLDVTGYKGLKLF